MWIFTLNLLLVLAQASNAQPEIPWWLAVALGPTGLTAYLLYNTYTLKKEIKAKDLEITRLNEERHKDLVGGLTYREQQTEKLLVHDQATRQNLNKLAEALKELGKSLERNDGNTAKVLESIRGIEVRFANLQGRFGGGSRPDLRT